MEMFCHDRQKLLSRCTYLRAGSWHVPHHGVCGQCLCSPGKQNKNIAGNKHAASGGLQVAGGWQALFYLCIIKSFQQCC